jgi:uncharacterized OB-fold protein
MSNEYGAPIPVPDPDSAGFWLAAVQGRLTVARCLHCGIHQHPPAEVCRHCAGALRFEDVTGAGTIFSFIVVRHQTVPGHEPPYVVAIVEFPEQSGVRVTGVVQAPADEVRIGMPVSTRMVAVAGSELCAPQFVPLSSSA